METDMRNSEGYADETPFLAMPSIKREERRRARMARRPLVYICSPFAGDIGRNVQAARRYSRFAVAKGAIPLAPHLLFPQFMDDSDPAERELALHFGRVLLDKCAEVWVFGARVSEGMRGEIERAERRGLAVRRFGDDLKEA